MIFFQQEIPPGSRSGRIKFQGGQVIMILEGQGYTVDRRRQAHLGSRRRAQPAAARRAASSCSTSTPIPNVTVKFVATEPNWIEGTFVDRGCGFEQLEDAPEYRR